MEQANEQIVQIRQHAKRLREYERQLVKDIIWLMAVTQGAVSILLALGLVWLASR